MSLTTLRSGASAHAEDNVLQLGTDLISSGGVVSISDDHFLVEAQSVPDMTVKVNSGRAHVKVSTGNAYPVIMDADTNVTIGANSSGNSRIDAVVLYIDKSATPTTTADNVAKLTTVQGTPAGSPSAPSDGDISTALGASNPFLRLANVTVASGATSITSGNIADARVGVVAIESALDNGSYSGTPNIAGGANTNWFTITGAEASVTTRKASKVFVFATLYTAMSTSYANYGWKTRLIVGTSTQVGRGFYFNPQQSSINMVHTIHGVYTSTAAETLTFKVQLQKEDSAQNLTGVDVVLSAFVIPD